MLGGADNPNGELPSYITGADTYGHHVLRDGNPHHLDAARFTVRNTDELLGSGVCGVLTV